MLPRSRKASPPNICFSRTDRRRPSSCRTRAASFSLNAMHLSCLGPVSMDQAKEHAEQRVLDECDTPLHRDPRRDRWNCVLTRLAQDDVRREKAAERPGKLDAVPHHAATALERGEEKS